MSRRRANSGSEAPLGCLIAFCSIFFIAGFAAIFFLSVRPMVQSMLASNWVEVPCTILTSEVEENSSSDGSTYRVAITYRYGFDGTVYTGDRYDFTPAATSGRESKAAIVAGYPVGSEHTCFVNPDDPTEAVIVTSSGSTLLFGLIGVPFLAIPGLILFFAVRSKRRKEGPRAGRASHRPRARGKRSSSAVAASPAARDEDGFVQLERKQSRLTKALLLGGVAIFWNGISWFGVVQVWSSHDGAFRIGILLFLSLFVLIGLGLVAAAGHATLSIFSPSATLRLRRGGLRPGDTIEFAWEFAGRTEKIESLTITFVGMERATYQVGTDTRTDEHRFHDVVCIERSAGEEIAFGTGEATIPAGTMPSFSSRHNEVVWFLELKAAIPRWPDVESEFPVPVHPFARVDASPAEGGAAS